MIRARIRSDLGGASPFQRPIRTWYAGGQSFLMWPDRLCLSGYLRHQQESESKAVRLPAFVDPAVMAILWHLPRKIQAPRGCAKHTVTASAAGHEAPVQGHDISMERICEPAEATGGAGSSADTLSPVAPSTVGCQYLLVLVPFHFLKALKQRRRDGPRGCITHGGAGWVETRTGALNPGPDSQPRFPDARARTRKVAANRVLPPPSPERELCQCMESAPGGG